jgi:hypothetical protein
VRARLRRFIAGISLANYLALLVGLPLPLPVIKDGSQPFPCQHHRCGCKSADQCWRGCCCFTPAQKLAWARENGITPPPALLLAEGTHHSDHDEQGCCEASGTHDHLADSAQQKSSCCADHHEPSVRVATKRETVIGLHALRCQGGSSVWLGLSMTVLPLELLVCAEDRTPGEWLAVADNAASGASLAFDSPPPRA